MPSPTRPSLPPAALSWLVGPEPGPVLALGCSPGMIGRLTALGHGVLAVDADPARVARTASTYRGDEHVMTVVGRPDELPLQPCVAQVVLVQGRLRPQPSGPAIRQHAAHGQISRCLQAGGWVAGWQIVRDDTVPWVRRLIALMRRTDPDAMSGGASADHEDLLASKYFPRIERRDFRLWVPITRADLVEMVTSQLGVSRMDERSRRQLVEDANQIFDSAARISELRLPYQLRCWQAHVDHHELTQPISFSDGALVIPI